MNTYNKRETRDSIMQFYAEMNGAFQALSVAAPEVIEELQSWERANLNGADVKTSDWPGWQRLGIIKPDRPPHQPAPKKRQLPTSLRATVYARDGLACRTCGATANLTVDHIYPESAGGGEDVANLQTLCRACNSRKRALTPGVWW